MTTVAELVHAASIIANKQHIQTFEKENMMKDWNMIEILMERKLKKKMGSAQNLLCVIKT